MPAVSVIIPVYKVEPYIARCVRTLFGQTLQDMEFIFVDDCTPDRSMDVMWQVLEEFPDRKALADELDLVTCDFSILDTKNSRVQRQFSTKGREVTDILSDRVWGNIWCRMFKRSLWDGIIPPDADMWEDMVFSIQLLSRARHVGYVPLPLYLYFRRADSICFAEGEQAALNRWTSIGANARLILDYLGKCPFVQCDADDLLYFKYRTRAPLVPYVHIHSFYRMWRDSFPEVDRSFLFAKGISWDAKFWFILIHLHLYYPWKKVTGFIRNR